MVSRQLPPKVDALIRDIKEVKIQGARNVAKAALEAVQESISSFKGSADELKSLLSVVIFRLMNARPTEPMTRDLLTNLLQHLLAYSNLNNVDKMKKAIMQDLEEHLEKMEASLAVIADIGANLIENGSVVMTICHSSTVTTLLKKAHDRGKLDEVISCETRPLFQGRITAKELADHGIRVKSIVDGAMAHYMDEADIVIVGADAIQADGSFVNKIGTRALAIVAKEHNAPFYSAAELFKYDAQSIFGFRERIEMRDPAEVWPEAPKHVRVLNPAFDLIEARYLTAYITERGIVTPQSLPLIFKEAYSSV